MYITYRYWSQPNIDSYIVREPLKLVQKHVDERIKIENLPV